MENNDATIRVQFDLPSSKLKEIERMMKETDISTRKDLFNNALALFEWAISEAKEGKTIASIDEVNKKYKELVMPPLLAVAPKKKETIFS